MDNIESAISEHTTRPVKSLADPSELNRSVLRVLVEKIPPEVIADKIESLLQATRPTKHGEVADTRSQEAGVKLWLAYCVGLPIQRTENVNVTLDADSEVGARDRLAKSPAARKRLRQMLDELDAVEVEEIKS